MPPVRQNLFSNLAALGTAKGMDSLVFGVLTIYLARVLGTESFGRYEFAIAIFTLFNIPAMFGTSKIGMRMVARETELASTALRDWVNHLTGLRLVTGAGCYLLLAGATFLVPRFAEDRMLILIASLSILLIPFSFEWFFIGVEQMRLVSIKRMLMSGLFLLLVLVAVNQPGDVILVAWAKVLAGIIATGFLLSMFARQYSLPRPTINLPAWRIIIADSLPVALAGVMTQIYLKIDVIMLGNMRADHEVGLYTAAYRIILFLLGIRTMGLNVLFPSMCRSFTRSRQELSDLVSSTQKIGIALGLPAGVAGTMLAAPIMVLAFGESFREAAPAFAILIWSVTLLCLNFTFPQLLIAADRQKAYMTVVNIGGVLNVILNLVLIPSYGIVGAALATVTVDLLSFGIFFLIARKIVDIDLGRLTAVPVAAAVCMAGVLSLVTAWPVVAAFAAAFAVYSLILVATGYLRRHDFSFLFTS